MLYLLYSFLMSNDIDWAEVGFCAFTEFFSSILLAFLVDGIWGNNVMLVMICIICGTLIVVSIATMICKILEYRQKKFKIQCETDISIERIKADCYKEALTLNSDFSKKEYDNAFKRISE